MINLVGFLLKPQMDKELHLEKMEVLCPFLNRHFDFVYDLTFEGKNGPKTVLPYFISVIYPCVLQSEVRGLAYHYERQKWTFELLKEEKESPKEIHNFDQ